MSKLKIGIVEDEVIIADHIADMIQKLGYIATEPVDSYAEAIQMIESEKPDLLLLDIQIKGKKDGIDLAQKIKEEYHIPFIFLTANADSVTVERAKKVNPSGYLVKPFTKDDLYTAIEICFHNSAANNVKSSTSIGNNQLAKDSLFIKDGQQFHKVKCSDILYLESEHVYVNVHTQGKVFLVRSSLQDYHQQLFDNNFFRIHRSYIINLDHVKTVNSESVTINDITLPIGKSYKEELFSKLNLK